MAEIRPFRAWRYNPEKFPNLNLVCSPLFDVVTPAQRERLYTASPHNAIHINIPKINSLPSLSADGHINNRYEYAKYVLDTWKKGRIIIQDSLPSLYIYYQFFTHLDSSKTFIRKGFICNIRLHEWKDKIILPHEDTIPEAVNDRLSVLEHIRMHTSPTHGLYADGDFELEEIMDKYMENPIYRFVDYQGIEDRLTVIQNYNDILPFLRVLKEKQVILADGHHRYEGSLLYAGKCREKNHLHTGQEGYNFHMIYLTNRSSDHLKILPTHRLLMKNPGIEYNSLIKNLSEYFETEKVTADRDIIKKLHEKPHRYCMITNEGDYLLTLKNSLQDFTNSEFQDQGRILDSTILHKLVFEKIISLSSKKQKDNSILEFSRDLASTISRVRNGEAFLAFLLKEITVDDIAQVCARGGKIPPKTSYFYPKVIAGFTFGSIDEKEFHSPLDSCFKISQEERDTA